MTMSEENMDRVLETVRETYNPPGDTPREEMWNSIAARLDATEVVDLAAERQRRGFDTSRSLGWAVAAAAVLVIGIGIGRMTAPGTEVSPMAATAVESSGTLSFATAEHFGRTEELLTILRADARSGRIDPTMAEWANGLLTETRMLLDANKTDDSQVESLLEDLELVLAQIVGVTGGSTTMDESRARTELQLALSGLEDRELLSRLQAASPQLGMAGTQ